MNLVKEITIDLKKHINLIHCSNNFTLMQRKLFNALLYTAYNDLSVKKNFVISTKNLCNMIGYNSNDTESLKKALLDLMSVTIQWNIIDSSSSQDDKWKASTALASVQIEKGICIYEYSSVMQELLYQPKIYARIDMDLLPKFKSNYGLALYENCIRYKNIPQTPWFSLNIFKKLMGVNENNYALFRDFKKRVLDVAVKEVNAHSPICVTPEIKRVSKKVVDLRFLIQNKAGDIKKNQDNIESNVLINRLLTIFGLSEELVKNILSTYSEDYIQEKIDYVQNSESFKQKKIKDLCAYLLSTLKKDYKRKITKDKSVEKKGDGIIDEKGEEIVLREQYNFYINSEINKFIASLAADALKGLNECFLEHLRMYGNIVYRMYLKRGSDHPAVKACFCDFIRQKYSNDIGSLLSFEEFVKRSANLKAV